MKIIITTLLVLMSFVSKGQLIKSIEHKIEYKGNITFQYDFKTEVEFTPIWFYEKPASSIFRLVKHPYLKIEMKKTVLKTDVGFAVENSVSQKKLTTWKFVLKRNLTFIK